jgi:hypothetical protein
MIKNRRQIDEQAALQIAVKQASKPPDVDVSQFKIFPSNPGIHIYAMPTEPCWFVYAPWGDKFDGIMLRSSRVIIISKQSGKVLYDGSTNDEG